VKHRSKIVAIAAIGGVLIAGCAVMSGQLRRQRNLHREIAVLRAARAELTAVRAENERLSAQLTSPEERAHLRASSTMLEPLRADVAALRRRSSQAGIARPLPSVAPAATRPVGMAPAMPASGWTDAGAETPRSAVETALWAATGGDVDALAQLLDLSPAARTVADALLASLPLSERAIHGSPERLVALLTAADVPLGMVRWSEPVMKGADAAMLRVQLRDAAGRERDVNLHLQRRSTGWRLVVPESAIQGYAAQLAVESLPRD
jgi:type II secretory pathway pseudopilin PulG